MIIQQLSGIDTAVSQEKYLGYGTVKSKIANAYNRLPLEMQKLKFNQVLQDKLAEEIDGIGKPRSERKKARAEKREKRQERRKEDKGLRALRLFMPFMRRKLKKKGIKINDPKSIKEVATLFRTNIMGKGMSGYDDNTVIGVDPVTATEGVKIGADIVKKIVDFIKGIIKKIKSKKNKGEKLSAEEQEDLKDGEAQEKDEKQSGGGFGGGMALPLLAAGAAAFFLFKK